MLTPDFFLPAKYRKMLLILCPRTNENLTCLLHSPVAVFIEEALRDLLSQYNQFNEFYVIPILA